MATSSKRTIPLPHKNGTAYRVSLPDGSSQHILLREVDELVSLLENMYEGSVEAIHEVDDLIQLLLLKQEEEPAASGGYTADTDVGSGGAATATTSPTTGHDPSDKRSLRTARNRSAYDNADPKPPKYTGPRGGEYYLQSEMRSIRQGEEGEETEGRPVVSDEQYQRLEDKVSESRNDVNSTRLALRDAIENGTEEEIVDATENTRRATNRLNRSQRVYDKAQASREGAETDEETVTEEPTVPLDPSMENLERLIQADPNSAEVFKVLDHWSQEEQKLRDQYEEDPLTNEEYIDHPAVQNLMTALNKIAGRSSGEGIAGRDGTNWKNIERVTDIPFVKNMLDADAAGLPEGATSWGRDFRQNNAMMNTHMPRLLERIDSNKTITPKVLAYFEEHGKLPPMGLDDDSEAGKKKKAWEDIPLDRPEYEDLLNANWDEADLKTELPIKGYEVTASVEDLVKQVADMQGVMHNNLRLDPRGRRGTVPLSVRKDKNKEWTYENTEIIQLSHEAAYEITEYLVKNRPDQPDPDILSSPFMERFQDLSDHGLSDPSIGTNHLVRELYGATKFSEFHQELGMDLEKSSNSLLAGLIKDSIARTTGGEIIHHGSGDGPKRNRFKIRETTHVSTTEEGKKIGRTGQRVGSFVSIERGYDLFDRDHVDGYVGFHRALNRQLLDITYPDTNSITVYRGTNRAEIAEDTGGEDAAVITPRRRRGFFRTLFRPKQQEVRRDMNVGIVSNPLSSFSTSPEIARGFARNPRSTRGPYDVTSGPYENTPPYEGGVCLAVELNKDDIFSTYGNGHSGSLRQGNEGEMWGINSGGNLVAKAFNPEEFQDAYYEVWDADKEGRYFIDDPERPGVGERVRQIYAKALTISEFHKMFAKQQEIPKFHIVVDDPVNSDWITTSYDSSIPKPDLGLRSNMEALPVPFPWEVEEAENEEIGRKSGMERTPVEDYFVPHTTPTVQKQRELGQTLAEADPVKPAKPSKEDTVHPSAQGKVRTYINELVHRAGRTFERRRTAWVRPKVAEALESRQKASDWLRLLGNYLALYFVGGFIRDKLTGKVSREIDIISLDTLDKVKEVFEEVNLTFEQMKTTKGRPSIVFKVGDMKVRIVCLEAEDLPKELMQRDFTINAVAQSVTGQFYDPSNGLADLKSRVLRSPKNGSVKKFEEDPIRILRAARFMSHYNLKVHPSVVRAIRKHSDKLSDVSNERIGKELTQILQSENPKKAFEFLQEYSLLGYIDPALEKMVGFRQNTSREKWDVWRHTTTALRDSASEDLLLNLAILFHAIGKPDTANEDKSQFKGYEEASAAHAKEIMEKLGFPEDQINRVENLVKLHTKLSTMTTDNPESDFRTLKIQIGQDLERLIILTKADIKGSSIEVEEKLEALDNVLQHLNNKKFYESVSKDMDDLIKLVVNA